MTAETRKGSSRSAGAESVLPLAALLRLHDRDRFQTALFAPASWFDKSPLAADLAFLAMILLGGTLAAVLRGSLQTSFAFGPEHARLLGSGWRMCAALLVGGMFVGFGTRMLQSFFRLSMNEPPTALVGFGTVNAPVLL